LVLIARRDIGKYIMFTQENPFLAKS